MFCLFAGADKIGEEEEEEEDEEEEEEEEKKDDDDDDDSKEVKEVGLAASNMIALEALSMLINNIIPLSS